MKKNILILFIKILLIVVTVTFLTIVMLPLFMSPLTDFSISKIRESKLSTRSFFQRIYNPHCGTRGAEAVVYINHSYPACA